MLLSEKETPTPGELHFTSLDPICTSLFLQRLLLLLSGGMLPTSWAGSGRKAVEPIAQSAWLKWKSATAPANWKTGKEKFATKYIWWIEIQKVLIGYPVLGMVYKRGINRKCPERTSCTRKPKQSMELSTVPRDVRCWRMAVIWFWKFRLYWKRPGWIPALSKTQLHRVAAQEEPVTAGDQMTCSSGARMCCSLLPGCKPPACHTHTGASGISWDSLGFLEVELTTKEAHCWKWDVCMASHFESMHSPRSLFFYRSVHLKLLFSH